MLTWKWGRALGSKDGENVLQATLSVSQAQPWHEGKYQCNTLHPNYHYLRVVVNSKKEDLHRHRQREHHGKVWTTTMTTTTTTQDAPTLASEDGTTNEIGNDDVDSQIDAGTSTTRNEINAEDEDERRGEERVNDDEKARDEEEEAKIVEMDAEERQSVRLVSGDGGADDDLVVDIAENGRKIEKENAQVNELVDVEDESTVADDSTETTYHLIPYTTIHVEEEDDDDDDDIEELLLTTVSTTSVILQEVQHHVEKVAKVNANGAEIHRIEKVTGEEVTLSDIFSEKTSHDKQLANIVKSNKGDVLVPNYDNTEAKLKVFEIKHPLVLFCNVTEAGNHELQWFRNGTSVENLGDLKGRYTILKSEHKFVIDRTQESDAGLYTCNLPHLAQSKDINVVANVAVKLPSNTAVVEGEKLAIQCIVVGTDPIINWTILDNATAEHNDISYLPDERNVKDAILVIESARLTDRGNYTCEANNLATLHRITKPAVAVTFVRVKGKLAALWPFLGICAEVFILCAIILVYEKRRNKADPDESDTDQSPEQKLDPHGKESDVRHRK
ncbi:hypothetical protein DMENIID0001_123540 [Sergentomyia squamirostris]